MTPNDPWDVGKNLASIERQWAGFRALCDDEAVFRATAVDVSAWDAGQHVKHCAIVLNRIVGAIEMMLANPQQGVGLGPTVDRAMPMLISGNIPRGMGKAATFLIPEPEPDRDETRAMVESAVKLWSGLSARRNQIRDCPATFAHFALGNFTSPQWVRFMTVHSAHHFKIVRDILEAAEQGVPFNASVETVN
jgi:hypothetical protein